MNMEILMQYIMYMLVGIGILAFITSIITQVIKEMPGLANIQTNAVALVISIVITVLAVVTLCIVFKIQLLWYYIVGAVIASFLVYMVATSGWEKVAEMWRRTKWEEVEKK
jgi:hypothetical protein